MRRKGSGDPARVRKAHEKSFVESLVKSAPESAAFISEVFAEKPPTVPFNARVPQNELEEFKAECVKRGWSQTHALRVLMKFLKHVPYKAE